MFHKNCHISRDEGVNEISLAKDTTHVSSNVGPWVNGLFFHLGQLMRVVAWLLCTLWVFLGSGELTQQEEKLTRFLDFTRSWSSEGQKAFLSDKLHIVETKESGRGVVVGFYIQV